jgi:hypothetical protein
MPQVQAPVYFQAASRAFFRTGERALTRPMPPVQAQADFQAAGMSRGTGEIDRTMTPGHVLADTQAAGKPEGWRDMPRPMPSLRGPAKIQAGRKAQSRAAELGRCRRPENRPKFRLEEKRRVGPRNSAGAAARRTGRCSAQTQHILHCLSHSRPMLPGQAPARPWFEKRFFPVRVSASAATVSSGGTPSHVLAR